jgi:perosamine synthetase
VDFLERECRWVNGELCNKATSRRVKAILPVHILGHPVDMDPILEVARKYNLAVIEDATESVGAKYKGRMVGHLGDIACFSFNGNKIITTGGGGAVLCRDPELARHAKHLTTTAKLPHPWAFEHDEVAFNYRLPNLNAALGVAQLAQLPQLVQAKRRLADVYLQAFTGMDGVAAVAEPNGCRSNYWLNLLLLPDARERDALLARTHEAGLLLRPFWTPMHRLPMYRDMPRAALPVAEDLYARGVCLPSSAHLAAMHEDEA